MAYFRSTSIGYINIRAKLFNGIVLCLSDYSWYLCEDCPVKGALSTGQQLRARDPFFKDCSSFETLFSRIDENAKKLHCHLLRIVVVLLYMF